MVFTMAKLREFCNMNSSELESIEKLEQLRVLETVEKLLLWRWNLIALVLILKMT